MCTITYIPKEDGSFILTQSRDELASRSIATPPVSRKINNIEHLFPVDPDSKGTWIGMSANQKVACLINGGNSKYIPQPPYKHSRGLIIPKYFESIDFNDFYNNYQFDNLEPFTLLVLENGKFLELRKEPETLVLRELDNTKPYIFSSVNLYNQEIHHEKEKMYNKWLESNSNIQPMDTIVFHDNFRIDKEGPVFLKNGKDKLQTVSTTAIHFQPKTTDMIYFDRINDMTFAKTLKFRNLGIAA